MQIFLLQIQPSHYHPKGKALFDFKIGNDEEDNCLVFHKVFLRYYCVFILIACNAIETLVKFQNSLLTHLLSSMLKMKTVNYGSELDSSLIFVEDSFYKNPFSSKHKRATKLSLKLQGTLALRRVCFSLLGRFLKNTVLRFSHNLRHF